MAIISDGAGTGAEIRVSPASKAARVTLYNTQGPICFDSPYGRRTTNFSVRSTASGNISDKAWLIRAGSNDLLIRAFSAVLQTDATASSGATEFLTLLRFRTVAPAVISSGGAAFEPTNKRNSDEPASISLELRSNIAGGAFVFTSGAGVFEDPAAVIAMNPRGGARARGKNNPGFNINGGFDSQPFMVLHPGEGLAVSTGFPNLTGSAIASGSSYSGYIEWEEAR